MTDFANESTGTDLIDFDAEYARIAAESQTALVAQRGNFISLKGKVFTDSSGMVSKELTCIVIDYLRVNSNLPKYMPGVRAPATCWAIGRNESDMAPDPSSSDKVCELCSMCHFNKFKSHENGKAKKCQNKMRLMVVPESCEESTTPSLLHLPPTSLTNWTNHVNLMKRMIGPAGFCRVITKLTFAQNFDYPVVSFQSIGHAPNPQLIVKLRNMHQDTLMIPVTNVE